jgi:hypothetical protein
MIVVQEIITYLIVASAFFYAGLKISKVFTRRKKAGANQPGGKKQPGCDGCTAECILKDSKVNIPGKYSREKCVSDL